AAARWRLTFSMLREVSVSTASITSMVFIILFGASVFSIVFRLMGGDDLVHEFLSGLPGGALAAVAVVMVIVFFLGFILDTFEITFNDMPVTALSRMALDVEILFNAVIITIRQQTIVLTTPSSFSLFYQRGLARQ